MLNIGIYKPGTTRKRRTGKTNLQIHELNQLYNLIAVSVRERMPVQVQMKLGIYDSHIDAAQCDVIFVFCHAKEHEELFNAFLTEICNYNNKSIIFVSNDVRLPFNYSDQISNALANALKYHKVCCWTNASRYLSDYGVSVFGDVHIDIISMPLHAIVLRNLNSTGSVIPHHLRKDSCFFAMHHNDYDDHRKTLLQKIKNTTMINNVQYHEFGDTSESFGTIDASIVSDVMQLYAYTPIVLEKSYEYFGVMPNRISEALSSGTLPVYVTDDVDRFKRSATDLHNPVSKTLRFMLEQPSVICDNFGELINENNLNGYDIMLATRTLIQLANMDREELKEGIINVLNPALLHYHKQL